MKKNKCFKRIVCISFICIMIFQLIGCAQEPIEEAVTIEPMEVEEAVVKSFDAIGGSDVMPISAFWGPYPTNWSYNANPLPDYYSDEFIKLIKDTGINMIGYNRTYFSSQKDLVFKLLEQGEKFNLGVIVYDDRLVDNVTEDTPLEAIDAMLNEYANYPAYVGNQMPDEPGHELLLPRSGRNMQELAAQYSKLAEIGTYANGNLYNVNMFGSADKYRQYVEDFVKLCKPQLLCYDFYPFIGEKTGIERYQSHFTNLTIIREEAEEAGIPFWAYVQTGGQWNDDKVRFDSEPYYPSKGEFAWNVGTLLAFGVKGIQYFPLIQPTHFSYTTSDPDLQRNGLLSCYGTKTRWYYYAQEMNKQIAAVDEVLMNSVNKGIIVTTDMARVAMQDSKYLMEGTAWRELTGVDGDAMIGCFNYQGKTALYVVNYDTVYAQEMTLNFADTYDVKVIMNAEESHHSADSLTLTFSAGNSALIVFE